MNNYTISNTLKEKARSLIPHQTGAFSRTADSFIEGPYPTYAQQANGCRFVDVDGNEFLDYFAGMGPVTLGYNYEKVNNAITQQLEKGVLFSIPPPVEVELAELIHNTIPHAEMIKFEKSGSNAVTAAIRAARALTKRDKIAYCGTGGVWHDWQAAIVSRDRGVPKFNQDLISVFSYNDIGGLEQIVEDSGPELAAVVLEPTQFESPTDNFLQKVRKIANENDSILVLDEVVTGFRFDLHGGQKYFDLKGDLVCFGKAIANGMPLSSITGPSEFMTVFDDLWVSSTNNSEALSLAAGKATIQEMIEQNTIPHCWQIGKLLMKGWNNTVEKHAINAKMSGYPVRHLIQCFDSNDQPSLPLKSLIMQELVKQGIFMSVLGAGYISYSHKTQDVEKTIDVLDNVCTFITNNVKNDNYSDFLEGPIPKPIWNFKIPPTKRVI